VIDRRTVLFIIEKGRNIDRYAILTFSEDLSQYKGYNFSQTTRLSESRKK
jgi:hypothetical protein